MNTNLKHWREAATLILAAGRRLGAGMLPSRTPESAAAGSPVADSCGRSHLPPSAAFDYRTLLLKRSSKSGYMPSAYVFPGGKVDSSDFSSDWLDIFESFADFPNFGLRCVRQPAGTRPPIFATDRRELGSPVPGEVALRICALRETFEESGVLLTVPKPEEGRLIKGIGDRGATDRARHCEVNGMHSGELHRWRSLVIQNPSNFARMCRELEVLPNIWALHEWSNWLTPERKDLATRFDTAFFLCCLQETPQTLQDRKEIERFQWSTPSEVLQSFQAQELFIPPPQFYELSRLCRFPSLNDLHNFASQRATKGCERWMPIFSIEDDQHISLIPGDKLYPLGTSEKTQVEGPLDDSALHRMVFSNPYTINLQITIKPKFNHLLPVLEPASSKSQL
ncbi:putative nucleoside diphosphate-linked moiety X motif 19 mitochondrial [Scophthalmus maximus]|uniref:Acyl-coenzyme A diphosphatase NUDT19 n=2 Tax=Scophthalmus maximus TaxID=52904 RepID=A0A2U9BDT4_SCOMX|nr:nucleoside diphosphate-linked moiety X motif 19 [Scophthalmus maximus]AWP01802.1 putative nucleoside diphosphate-linked moiety X motif 19 mitochondrial [Scophthalmus maximus]